MRLTRLVCNHNTLTTNNKNIGINAPPPPAATGRRVPLSAEFVPSNWSFDDRLQLAWADPSSLTLHPSSFIPHHSSFITHPSSFIIHPSSFITHHSSHHLHSLARTSTLAVYLYTYI
eukprot:GHVU01158651.1.p1 GENE.GHVU01158651.1~~GHVU01158651.1.p1  ORF type:complete len:117 (-),score=8.17 GHVU01158651.1:128-478(-)